MLVINLAKHLGLSAYRVAQLLSDMTFEDAVTGVYGPRYLRRFLEEQVSTDEPFVLTLFDLDRFGAINEARGPLDGDALLKNFATRLRTLLRGNDVVARYREDAFAVVTFGRPVDAIFKMVDRIRKRVVDRPVKARRGGDLIDLTMSAAIISFPEDAATIDGVFEAAETTLFAAKKQGGNRVMLLSEADPAARAEGAALAGVPCAKLIGRRDELERAELFVDEVRDRKSGILLVSGDRGIGKTRLLKDLVGKIRGRGVVYLASMGRGSRNRMSSALLYLVQRYYERHPATRDWLRRALSPLQRKGLSELVPLFSGWRGLKVDPAANLQQASREALEGALVGMAREAPLLLLLDNISEIDPMALEAIRPILRENKAPLGLIATMSGELGLDVVQNSLVELLADARKKRRLKSIYLPLITSLDVGVVIGETLPGLSRPAWFDEVLKRTCAGNPGQLEGTVRFLVEKGKLSRLGRSWKMQIESAQELAGLVQEASQRPPRPEAVQLLTNVAVLGTGLDVLIYPRVDWKAGTEKQTTVRPAPAAPPAAPPKPAPVAPAPAPVPPAEPPPAFELSQVPAAEPEVAPVVEEAQPVAPAEVTPPAEVDQPVVEAEAVPQAEVEAPPPEEAQPVAEVEETPAAEVEASTPQEAQPLVEAEAVPTAEEAQPVAEVEAAPPAEAEAPTPEVVPPVVEAEVPPVEVPTSQEPEAPAPPVEEVEVAAPPPAEAEPEVAPVVEEAPPAEVEAPASEEDHPPLPEEFDKDPLAELDLAPSAEAPASEEDHPLLPTDAEGDPLAEIDAPPPAEAPVEAEVVEPPAEEPPAAEVPAPEPVEVVEPPPVEPAPVEVAAPDLEPLPPEPAPVEEPPPIEVPAPALVEAEAVEPPAEVPPPVEVAAPTPVEAVEPPAVEPVEAEVVEPAPVEEPPPVEVPAPAPDEAEAVEPPAEVPPPVEVAAPTPVEAAEPPPTPVEIEDTPPEIEVVMPPKPPAPPASGSVDLRSEAFQGVRRFMETLCAGIRRGRLYPQWMKRDQMPLPALRESTIALVEMVPLVAFSVESNALRMNGRPVDMGPGAEFVGDFVGLLDARLISRLTIVAGVEARECDAFLAEMCSPTDVASMKEDHWAGFREREKIVHLDVLQRPFAPDSDAAAPSLKDTVRGEQAPTPEQLTLGLQALQALGVASQFLRANPPEEGGIESVLQGMCRYLRQLLDGISVASFEAKGTALTLNGRPLPADEDARFVATALADKRWQTLTVRKGITDDEGCGLASALSVAPADPDAAAYLRSILSPGLVRNFALARPSAPSIESLVATILKMPIDGFLSVPARVDFATLLQAASAKANLAEQVIGRLADAMSDERTEVRLKAAEIGRDVLRKLKGKVLSLFLTMTHGPLKERILQEEDAGVQTTLAALARLWLSGAILSSQMPAAAELCRQSIKPAMDSQRLASQAHHAFLGAMESVGQGAGGALMAMLSGGTAEEREGAMAVLGVVGAPMGPQFVRLILESDKTEVRQAAARAIMGIGGKAPQELMASVTAQADPAKMQRVLGVLDLMGLPRLIGPVQAALAHPDAGVKKAGFDLLERAPEPAAEDALRFMIRGADDATTIRSLEIAAGRKMGGLATEIVRLAQATENEAVACACCLYVQAIPTPAAVPALQRIFEMRGKMMGLVKGWSEKTRAAAIAAAVRIGTPTAKSLVKLALKESSAVIREAANPAGGKK